MQSWRKTRGALRLAVGGLSAAVFHLEGAPAAAQSGVARQPEFAPHRAIYDVTLERATPGSGIAELTGRMVYELTGAACEGFTQNFRYVTVSQDQEGASQTGDLRSSTWEDAAGAKFRFENTQYQEHKLASETEGTATRKSPDAAVRVDLIKPSKQTAQLPADVVFPMQHAKLLLEAAISGKLTYSARLFDGSEKGEKVSYTTAVIGRATPAGGAVKMPAKLSEIDKLVSVPSWPISIAFFQNEKTNTDAVPETEQSYRFYANGVSTDLVSDFGDYTLRFDLTELAFLPPAKCAAPAPR